MILLDIAALACSTRDRNKLPSGSPNCLSLLQKQVSSIPFYRHLISFTQIRNVNKIYNMMRYLNMLNASFDLLLQSLSGSRQCPQHQRCTKANKEIRTDLPVLRSIA